MILRESVIGELRLRDRQVAFIKINIIRVDTGEKNSGIDKEWINKQLERISSGDNPEVILVKINTKDVKVGILPL